MNHGHPSHAHILAAQLAMIDKDLERARLHIAQGLEQGGRHKIPFLRQAVRCFQKMNDIQSARHLLDLLWQKSRKTLDA